MKTVSNYQIAKNELKNVANEAKRLHSTDKPLIRMYINDFADHLIKELNFSDYQTNLLSSYACKLHPKD